MNLNSAVEGKWATDEQGFSQIVLNTKATSLVLTLNLLGTTFIS